MSSVSGVLLAVSLHFKRYENLAKYRRITYAFFVASMVNLISNHLKGYYSAFLRFFIVWSGTNPGIGLSSFMKHYWQSSPSYC
jgi:hypothetical protein